MLHPVEYKPLPQRWRHKAGDRFGSLVILERLGKVNGSQRVLVRCDCGTEKELPLQNLQGGATTNCADRSVHPDPRRKEEPGYHGAHQRVHAAKGKASAHRCSRCGEQAEQWAFSNGDLGMLREAEGKDAGLAYSLDPEHYEALCRPCHKRFDQRHREIVGDGEGISLLHVGAWHLRQGISGVLDLSA